ncbi:MAG: putative heme transporter [Acidimicrobiaceae bacterium]|jgi:uncharacterized protein (TIRG00374 family)
MTVRRLVMLGVTLVALVVVWPTLTRVYSELGDTVALPSGWLTAIGVVVAVQMIANWQLYRIILRTPRWFDVAAPQLVSNSASHLLPGGNAIGPGIQVRMMTIAGFPMANTVTALGAASVIGTVAGFVVLPVVVLAASATGSKIDSSLILAMWVGAALLMALLIATVAMVSRERPWHWVARGISWGQARLRRPSNVAELERRLLDERDLIRIALRDRAALVGLIALARPVCDYLALYFALRATGAHVNPAAVLAAFIVSNIAGMIPFTPGGLGFVEASLAGVLTVAGATDPEANLAVATYRLTETWLPCLAGIIAYVWFRRRHHVRRNRELLVAEPSA